MPLPLSAMLFEVIKKERKLSQLVVPVSASPIPSEALEIRGDEVSQFRQH